jgi:hypothetical protein
VEEHPLKAADHALDAMRYALHAGLPGSISVTWRSKHDGGYAEWAAWMEARPD